MSLILNTAAPLLDANGDGVPNVGFVAASGGKTTERDYRYRVNDRFALSPDVQYVAASSGGARLAPVNIPWPRAWLTF